MTRKTISTPKARARILFVLSGPLPRCKKKTRWTPICAKARTTSPTGMPGGPEKIGLRDDERGDRRQDRKHQPRRIGQVAGRRLMLFDARRAVVEHAIVTVHQASSHQVNQREYADPDDVERMPEQAPAQQAPQHGGSQALQHHLGHQIDEPEQAAR